MKHYTAIVTLPSGSVFTHSFQSHSIKNARVYMKKHFAPFSPKNIEVCYGYKVRIPYHYEQNENGK